jgi:hypothetical protein
MAYALKFALQTLVWLVAIILANNLIEKFVGKIKLIKPWKFKKA